MNLKHVKDSSYPELLTVDGKYGFYEDFKDEDTGEVIRIFREVPEGFSFEKVAAEKEAADEQFRAEEAERHEKLHRLWDVESEMETLQYELDTELPARRSQLESDQEQEVGSIMRSDPSRADEVAQEYGRRFNEIDEREAEVEEELERLGKLRHELMSRVDFLWTNDSKKSGTKETAVDKLRALAKSYFEEINYEPPKTTINGREFVAGSYGGGLWGIYVESFDHKKFRYYKNWVGLVEDRWDDLSDEWYQSCIDNAKAKEYIEVEAESWAEERDAESQRESW